MSKNFWGYLGGGGVYPYGFVIGTVAETQD
jgi:hypothetical protein